MVVDVPGPVTPQGMPCDPVNAAGASALTRYRVELARGRRRRLAVRSLAAGTAGLVVGLLDWRFGAAGALAVAAADLGRCYTRGPAAPWRKGAAGERATARLLAPLALEGYAILHDRAIPHSSANVDHILIGPTGVFVLDSKRWHRRTRLHGVGGTLWVGSRTAAFALRGLAFEHAAVQSMVRRATSSLVDVGGLVAVHGPRVPSWRNPVMYEGLTLLRARQVPRYVRAREPRLAPEQVAELAAGLARVLPPYGRAADDGR
ncbi:nuclease-related domain-containing protein [Microbispora sp. NBRC 16548]|uniref:nuclease-related domain-containing protein n=1 Tax=Microbispora sp. NBRC 16548 TaxID=3030994 RepID=UPI0024A10807|nr:nuclease-related domain-containing protein [Microbispora sp. NBRC 16548]GLX06808.1 hypothetical protein Misp03_37350 [Microbispora sp. NBRC 16548]